MKKIFLPYNFDVNGQYQKYACVGKERDKEHYREQKGRVARFFEKICKRRYRKTEEKQEYNTYLDWRQGLYEELPIEVNNLINLKHYLKGKLRAAKTALALLQSVVTPVMLTLYTIIDVFSDEGKMMNAMVSLVLIFIIYGVMIKDGFVISNKIHFYKDCIALINEKRKDIKNKK